MKESKETEESGKGDNKGENEMDENDSAVDKSPNQTDIKSQNAADRAAKEKNKMQSAVKPGATAVTPGATVVTPGATSDDAAVKALSAHPRSIAFRSSKHNNEENKAVEESHQEKQSVGAVNLTPDDVDENWKISPATATTVLRRSAQHRHRKAAQGDEVDSKHPAIDLTNDPSQPQNHHSSLQDTNMDEGDKDGNQPKPEKGTEEPPTLQAQLVDNIIDAEAFVVDERGNRNRMMCMSFVALLLVASLSVAITLVTTNNQNSGGDDTEESSASTSEPTDSSSNKGPPDAPTASPIATMESSTIPPEDFVVPSSRCFFYLDNLHDKINQYVELQASSGNYTTIEAQQARQEIADEYGWPIGEWCTSNLRSLRLAFSPTVRDDTPALPLFNEDISSWDVSKVTDFTEVFWGGWSFNQPLNTWDVSNAVTMAWMFEEAEVFDQSLADWNVSKVENFQGMFSKAQVFNQNLSSWDVSSATNMENMFGDNTEFNGDISTWNVSKVETMSEMFVLAFGFNSDISSWDVSRVTSMDGTFVGCVSFNQDLSRWNVGRAETLEGMFFNCESFDQNISAWNTSSCVNMMQMFDGGLVFNSDISRWDTSAVTNMRDMFYQCKLFNHDISLWDVSRVEDMDSMFSLALSFNQDLSSWRPDMVTTYDGMFFEAKSFAQDLCSWGPYMSSLEEVNVNEMFSYSGCEVTDDPNVSGSIVGPLCVECV